MPERARGRTVYGPYFEATRQQWRVAIRTTDAAGPSVRVARYATKEDAEQAAANMRASNPDHQQRTIREWVGVWELERRGQGYSVRACAQQSSKILQLIGGDAPLWRLSVELIRRRIAERTQSHASATVASELRATRQWVCWLVGRGLVSAQLQGGLGALSVPGRRGAGKAQLTRDEAARLVSWCMGRRGDGTTAVLACLVLGVRARELLDRRVRDLDQGGSVLVIWSGKTKTARRRIEVPPFLAARLRALTLVREGDAWLFRQEHRNKPRSTTWLQQQVRDACETAKVPAVCPHGLRGTHATLAEAAGVTAHAVAAQLGHRDPGVTERHYTAAGTRQQAAQLRVVAALGVV